LIDDSTKLINADSVQSSGNSGKGVKVAVLDSGIDKNHHALSGRVVSEVSTVDDEGCSLPGDHGTHIAGIIASGDSTYRGVAPECSLINVKVVDKDGFGQPGDVVEGFEEAIMLGADVINLSLGWSHLSGWDCDDGDCVLCRAADRAVELGVTVCVASGNEDGNASSAGANTSIRCPGNARKVITVGSVDKSKKIANYSSAGPTPYGATKPDVCAPGSDIRSSITANRWAQYNGTSMASPHVAGVCALMISENPDMTPSEVKSGLMNTAKSIGVSSNKQGAGLVDAIRAVSLAASAGDSGSGSSSTPGNSTPDNSTPSNSGSGSSSGLDNMDLAVRKFVNKTRVGRGEEIEVSVSLENKGSMTLRDVGYSDSVPSGFSLLRGSLSRNYDVIAPGIRIVDTYGISSGAVGRHTLNSVRIEFRDPSGKLYEISTNRVGIEVVEKGGSSGDGSGGGSGGSSGGNPGDGSGGGSGGSSGSNPGSGWKGRLDGLAEVVSMIAKMLKGLFGLK